MLNIIFAWSEISPMITFNDIKLKIIILHGNIFELKLIHGITKVKRIKIGGIYYEYYMRYFMIKYWMK